jgi:hypothetical protein
MLPLRTADEEATPGLAHVEEWETLFWPFCDTLCGSWTTAPNLRQFTPQHCAASCLARSSCAAFMTYQASSGSGLPANEDVGSCTLFLDTLVCNPDQVRAQTPSSLQLRYRLPP